MAVEQKAHHRPYQVTVRVVDDHRSLHLLDRLGHLGHHEGGSRRVTGETWLLVGPTRDIDQDPVRHRSELPQGMRTDHDRKSTLRPVIDRVMIVVAGGRSVRFGSDKLMTRVAGRPLVAHTVAAVIDHVDRCILVVRADQRAALAKLGLGAELVLGGPTRTASERAGLTAIHDRAGLIGIHDGARPLVPASLVESLFETAARVGGAIPVMQPVFPAVHRSDLSPVKDIAVAQTPQVFDGERLLAAYVAAAEVGYEARDTAEIARRFGRLDIEGVPGDPDNIKVTRPDDVEVVRSALETSRSGPR